VVYQSVCNILSFEMQAKRIYLCLSYHITLDWIGFVNLLQLCGIVAVLWCVEVTVVMLWVQFRPTPLSWVSLALVNIYAHITVTALMLAVVMVPVCQSVTWSVSRIGLDWARFNVILDTFEVISETVAGGVTAASARIVAAVRAHSVCSVE